MRNRTTHLYVRTRTATRAYLVREDGASMVEYAFLVALIAMVAFAAVTLVGQALDTRYDSIATSVVQA